MAQFKTTSGALTDAPIDHSIYSRADSAKMSVQAYINSTYQTDPDKYGTAFDQVLASVGLVTANAEAHSSFGQRAPTMHDVFEGRANFSGAANTQGFGSPVGNQARALFPIALIAMAEVDLVKDYETNAMTWDKMIGKTITVNTAAFEQPLVNYNTAGGPQVMRAQHRAQGANPASIMLITTSQAIRKIPSYSLGVEITNEAMKATTFDMVSAAVARQLRFDRDARVNEQIGDVFNGDLDLNIGSLASLGLSVNSSTLDAASTTTLTQKAWLKFLYRKQDYALKNWAIMDLDTYLKVEARTGRPSLTAIDTTLPRLEAHATVSNNLLGDINVMIVKAATDGGPLPANTILALDSRSALIRAVNLSANVKAAEQYALRQVEAFLIETGEMVYRDFSNAFDTLVIV